MLKVLRGEMAGNKPAQGFLGNARERREKERQQLADLVGKNLTYISQLEGLDFPLYKVLAIAADVLDLPVV